MSFSRSRRYSHSSPRATRSRKHARVRHAPRASPSDRRGSLTWRSSRAPRGPSAPRATARSVLVEVVRTRIVVDLSARRLTFFRNGRPVLHVPVAVGSSATPTPRGNFYVNQRVVPADPTGPFGPAALGISAFSPVLTHWAQGGPIAVHGTNDPGSIGRAASTGCIRVRNGVMRKLFAATPAGTPVSIRA